MLSTRYRTGGQIYPIARFVDPETGWMMYREVSGYDDDGMPYIAGHDGCLTLVRADRYRNYVGLVMFADDASAALFLPPAKYLELDGCLVERFGAKAVAEWHDQAVIDRAKHGSDPYRVGMEDPDETLVKIKTQITEL